MNNTKESTQKTYETAWRRYVAFCALNGAVLEDTTTLLKFLAHLDESGLMQSTIRTYAVAISATARTVSGQPLGQDKDVERMLAYTARHGKKSVKDNTMWDLGKALRNLASNTNTSTQFLGRKTAFLLAVTTCWRPASDLARISAQSIRFSQDTVTLSAHDVK